jgi:plasmid stabilization system protein ParE
MRAVFHPRIFSDLGKVMEYYERVATRELADDFYREFRLFVEEAVARPESFSIRVRDVRRANLRRFPYHFLFRVAGECVRILVVRHHRRRPTFGMRRR